jgi:hypothetical protein
VTAGVSGGTAVILKLCVSLLGQNGESQTHKIEMRINENSSLLHHRGALVLANVHLGVAQRWQPSKGYQSVLQEEGSDLSPQSPAVL